MKPLWQTLALAASLPLLASSASAVVLLTDNFTVTSNSNDVNQELALRQTGTLAPANYVAYNTQHQVGNPGTDVGQPGGAPNSNYLLLAYNSSFQSVIDIANVATGPITISFDMYLRGTAADTSTDPTTWGAFTLRGIGDAWPVVGSGEFGMLMRSGGGVQLFQNGNSGLTPGGWDTPGFGMADNWSFTFSDTAGTGSAFNGNGSKVTISNGTTTLGTITLGQLNSSNLSVGFRDYDNRFIGIDNLSITAVPEPSGAVLLSLGACLAMLRRKRH